jgi:hypothetical protein
MRAHGSKSGVKNETPKLPETRESLGKIGIFLLLNSNFPHTKFNFLQWLSASREIRENLLQWLSAFFNSFPLSKKSKKIFFNGFPLSSTAFHFLQRFYAFFNSFPIFQRLSNFPQWLSNFPQWLSAFQEIQENLFTAASIRKITI